MNVGHSNLNFAMEVNVIYRCHMSPAKLKYLFKGKNVPPFTGQCIENGGLTYIFMKVGHSDLILEM